MLVCARRRRRRFAVCMLAAAVAAVTPVRDSRAQHENVASPPLFAGLVWGASRPAVRDSLTKHGLRPLAPEQGSVESFVGAFEGRSATVIAAYTTRGLARVRVTLPTTPDSTEGLYQRVRGAMLQKLDAPADLYDRFALDSMRKAGELRTSWPAASSPRARPDRRAIDGLPRVDVLARLVEGGVDVEYVGALWIAAGRDRPPVFAGIPWGASRQVVRDSLRANEFVFASAGRDGQEHFTGSVDGRNALAIVDYARDSVVRIQVAIDATPAGTSLLYPARLRDLEQRYGPPAEDGADASAARAAGLLYAVWPMRAEGQPPPTRSNMERFGRVELRGYVREGGVTVDYLSPSWPAELRRRALQPARPQW
jgi:hypothetical protein